jgi:hypothetical protein
MPQWEILTECALRSPAAQSRRKPGSIFLTESSTCRAAKGSNHRPKTEIGAAKFG